MMKRKLLIAVLIVIICESAIISGVLLYFLHSSRNQGSTSIPGENIDAYRERKLKSNPSFNIKVDIELSKNTVIIKQNMDFKKASETLFAYVPSVNNAETRVKRVYSENGVSSFSLKDTLLEVKCRETESNIEIEYEIILKNNVNFLAYDGNFYYLTNFLITPAVYNGNNPIISYSSKFGDPYIYDMNSYYVMFKTDKSLNIQAPGKKEEHVFGSNKITIFEASLMRDFPAVAYNTGELEKAEYDGIDIYYINSKASKDYVNQVLQYAEKNIGPYPYESLLVVRAPLSQKGMEFSNMIFISESCFGDEEELKRITYHEVLHQWFYGIIGTDQLNEPFLDEGLVNYLSIMLSNPKYFSGKGGVNIDDFSRRHLNSYISRDQYYNLAYNDSSVFFYTIHKKLGNNFYKLLQQLYAEKKYKILYFNEFMKYVSDYGGK